MFYYLICNFLKLFVFFFTAILFSCKSNSEVVEALNFDVKNNPLFNALTNLDQCTIDDDRMFIISDSKLLVINLKDASITQNEVTNRLLNEFSKEHKYINSIRFYNEFMYFSVDNEVYKISFNGALLKIFECDKEVYSFTINSSGNFLVSTYETVSLIDSSGRLIDQVIDKRLISPNYFEYKRMGISYFDTESIIIYRENKEKLECIVHNLRKVYNTGQITSNFYPSILINNSVIGFDYTNRSSVFSISLAKDEIAKVDLKQDFTPAKEELQFEEGVPNFRIFASASSFYVVNLNKDFLKVLKINSI